MALGMGRRELIAGLGSAALALPLAARAQQPTMPLIGMETGVPLEEVPPLAAAFRQGLAEAGYVEGKNLAIEKRAAKLDPDLVAKNMHDLIGLNVKVIFAGNPGALAAARNATTIIPVVGIDLESDPV